VIVLACALAGQATAKPQGLEANITRTTYGIPHITAKNWKSIGYGVGYAYAQDNLCMLAEDFATVAGERSLHFGTKEKTSLGFDPLDNLAADTFFRSYLDLATLRRDSLKTSKIARDLSEGYVAGYNRLLRDLGPDRVPEACRGKAWVRPITTDDMLRLTEKNALRSGALVLAQAIAYAAPPQEAKAEKVAALTGAQINNLPNPRNEAVENDLIVDNRCFIELGLNPTTLDDGLLAEVVDVARRWADRCDRSRIPCNSAWTQTQAQAIQTA
jgi:acyl-homoserine-lactone acylase